MRKYKTYRAGILTALFLYAIILFLPASYLNLPFRQILVVLVLFVFLFVYMFLFSMINYLKEPLWKKFAVILLLLGHYVPYFFIVMKYLTLESYYVIVAILNIPYIIAFLTVRNKEIKNLAHSHAYTVLLISLMRMIAIIMKFNLLNYQAIYNVIILIPTVLTLLMCQKMIIICTQRGGQAEVMAEQTDLL